MHSRTIELPGHAARRKAVARILKQVSKIQVNQCALEELQGIAIKVLPMPLSQDEFPFCEKIFYQPLEGPLDDPSDSETYPDHEALDCTYGKYDELTPILCARETAESFRLYLHQLSENTCAPAFDHDYSTDIGIWGCPLFELEGDGFEWRAAGLGMTPGWPGFKCSLVCDVKGDEDHLARGELMCIARTIDRMLRATNLVEYMVIPVLVFSFMGPRHGRILHAHYDGKRLIIQKSKLFDFGNGNISAMKTFVRWWCSSAAKDVNTEDVAAEGATTEDANCEDAASEYATSENWSSEDSASADSTSGYANSKDSASEYSTSAGSNMEKKAA
ncbi:hypothetical protein BJX61DRAFT_547804 [Aspergillus egyptiacus]|nr:hypothetical protein BJX61DRAFT_547804 [Aspergillus egyptiacus]